MRTLITARNIVNTQEVDEFLKEKIKNIEQQEIRSWVLKNLKTYIKNDLESVSKVTKYKSTDPDWLKRSVEEGTALKVVILFNVKNPLVESSLQLQLQNIVWKKF